MDKKITKLSEVQAELDAMTTEWSRLRNILEQCFKGQQAKLKDNDIDTLKNEIRQKSIVIDQMQSDNTELAQAW